MATATASGASGTTLLGKGGLSMFNMPTAGRPNFSTRATSCALLTVSVICVCVLVVCGVMIVREYALAKGYKASMCSVVSVANANEISCMFCGAGPKDKNKEKGSGACLWSRFPCLHVRVKYHVNGRETTGLLHPDSLQAASPYSQCSFSVCLKLPVDNTRAVEKYAQQWRDKKERPFECFVNSENEKHAIVSKMHTHADVLHSMLWPSLIILICGAIFLRLEMKRRGIDPCTCLRKNKRQEAVESQTVPTGGKVALLQCRQNETEPCKVECKLLKCSSDSPAFISSSLSSLDRLTKHGEKRNFGGLAVANGRVGTSLSAEGFRVKTNSPESSSNASPSSTKCITAKLGLGPLTPDAQSLHGSQGSRVMGLETPV